MKPNSLIKEPPKAINAQIPQNPQIDKIRLTLDRRLVSDIEHKILYDFFDEYLPYGNRKNVPDWFITKNSNFYPYRVVMNLNPSKFDDSCREGVTGIREIGREIGIDFNRWNCGCIEIMKTLPMQYNPDIYVKGLEIVNTKLPRLRDMEWIKKGRSLYYKNKTSFTLAIYNKSSQVGNSGGTMLRIETRYRNPRKIRSVLKKAKNLSLVEIEKNFNMFVEDYDRWIKAITPYHATISDKQISPGQGVLDNLKNEWKSPQELAMIMMASFVPDEIIDQLSRLDYGNWRRNNRLKPIWESTKSNHTVDGIKIHSLLSEIKEKF